MSEPSPSGAPVPAVLHELAELLRATSHLDPAARKELGNLIDELGQALPGVGPPHLADSTAHLVRALHQRKETSLMNVAKQRLEEAAVRAEAESPLAAGIARRIIDALANWGI